jgi:hypothetical protein
MYTTNGNGGTTAIGRRRVSARSLLQQDLNQSRLAAILASVLEHEADYRPTARELAQYHHVPEAYIRLARTWSPEKRQAVASGKDATGISALLNLSNVPLALPKPTTNSKPDDAALFAIVREAGIDRVLTIAAAVENSSMCS